MNHDLSHCDGVLYNDKVCEKRDSCQRYLAHLDLDKNPIPYRSYLSAYCCVATSCLVSGQPYEKEEYSEYLNNGDIK